MTPPWTPPWTWRRASKPAPPAPPLPPVLPALDAAFHDKPFIGVSYGELFPMPPPQPTVSQPSFRPDPPPWASMSGADLQAAVREIDAVPQGDQLTPVDRLKQADGGYSPPPWRPNEPPTRPLIPWKPPKPRWREEEQ